MKKSTVIMIVLVFAASVLIVGLFGAQLVSNQVVYCEVMTLNYVCWQGDEDAPDKHVDKNRSYDAATGEYTLVLKEMKEDVPLVFSCDLFPENARNRDYALTVVNTTGKPSDSIATVRDNKLYFDNFSGTLGYVKVTLSALDAVATKAKVTINVYVSL